MQRTALIIGVLVLLGVAAFFVLAQRSRDGAAPGLVNGVLAPCPDSPNCVSSDAGASDAQSVEPLPASSWDALPAVIEQLGGAIATSDADYVAATFKTPLMGFVDDVEFRRTEEAVHVRSASRVGRSDFGVNRKRVEMIRAALAK